MYGIPPCPCMNSSFLTLEFHTAPKQVARYHQRPDPGWPLTILDREAFGLLADEQRFRWFTSDARVSFPRVNANIYPWCVSRRTRRIGLMRVLNAR
jgi:hypothetical protein